MNWKLLQLLSTLHIISFHIYNQPYEVPLSPFYMERNQDSEQ